MERLFKSKLGELRTEKEWRDWAMNLYAEIGTTVPSNFWERVQKVLKLEEVEPQGETLIKKQESQTYGASPRRGYDSYPEAYSNLERIEWFEE